MQSYKCALLFIFAFASFLPSLKGEFKNSEEVWQHRAEEAKKSMMDTYVSNPLQATDEFNNQTNRYAEINDSLDLDEESNKLDSIDDEEDEESEEENDVDKYNNNKNNDDNDNMNTTMENSIGNSTMEIESSNSTRRTLRQGKSRYKGPCQATNEIDQCWRCRQWWGENRKKLANCARGFGRRTTGGKDGKFYVVHDNSDDEMVNPKPGTLRHAVIQKGPLWITFSHHMNIKLRKELIMTSNKTIDGRGANVHISYGAGITIQYVKNVIIHGIRIHHISPAGGGMIRDSVDHFGFRTNSEGDGISIFGSTNIWIDHVSMSRCQDGLIDAVQGSTGITISNCHFTHHNDAILLGASDSFSGDQFMQVTVAFNHFGQGLVQRMPRCRWGFFHVVNNDYTNWKLYAIGGSKHPTIISQGNRFFAPDNQFLKKVTKRDYATEAEWRNWVWRSEGDLMMNGAVFVQSGNPNLKVRPNQEYIIKAKPGLYATRLTRFAGALDCFYGRVC